MRKLLQFLFKKPVTWFANAINSQPQKIAVFKSLSKLYNSVKKNKNRIKVLNLNLTDKFIIFSDQHKGNRDAADDFTNNEINYLAALQYYHQQNFSFINLGDSEELWKYTIKEVLPNNEKSFAAEAAFQPNKYFKTFGNHDILWKNKWDAERFLIKYFTMPLPIYEGIILKLNINNQLLNIFLTHGHQGDKMSDNNGFSTWFVAHIWAPIQRYLKININTPSQDDSLRNKHNKIMYEWSSNRKSVLLITGHTHLPVFASGKYSNHLANNIESVDNATLKPTYFNTGCCCFNDGDITGIEIASGNIRLIKWHQNNNISSKKTLEEISFEKLIKDL